MQPLLLFQLLTEALCHHDSYTISRCWECYEGPSQGWLGEVALQVGSFTGNRD